MVPTPLFAALTTFCSQSYIHISQYVYRDQYCAIIPHTAIIVFIVHQTSLTKLETGDIVTCQKM